MCQVVMGNFTPTLVSNADPHDLGWSYFPLSSMSSFSFWGPALLPMAPLAALVMGKLSSPLLEGTANSSSSPFGGSTSQEVALHKSLRCSK